jgi:phenolic acid decarboxylase
MPDREDRSSPPAAPAQVTKITTRTVTEVVSVIWDKDANVHVVSCNDGCVFRLSRTDPCPRLHAKVVTTVEIEL